MNKFDNTHIGKSAELHIISILLKRNFDVYVPVCDRRGIDFIVKSEKFYKFQVKARRFKRYSDEIIIRHFKNSKTFFIVCFDIVSMNYYVLPSNLISERCKKIGDKKQWFVITLEFLKSQKHLMNYKGFDKVFS